MLILSRILTKRSKVEPLISSNAHDDITKFEVPRFTLNTKVWELNPLSANFTKWSNTLKQFISKLPTNCLSEFDHFVGLALKGLTFFLKIKKSSRSKGYNMGKNSFLAEVTFNKHDTGNNSVQIWNYSNE